MSTIKVDTIATRTGSGNITLSNNVASLTSAGAISGTNLSASGTLAVTGNATFSGDIIKSTSGTSNFCAGVNAGNSIASGGNNNVCVGDEAGTAITTGDLNVALGSDALKAVTTTSSNTAVGAFAMDAGTGSENTAIGAGALGDGSNTGSNNTAIGKDAGNAITSGAKNTILGCYNGNQDSLDIRTSSNNIVISDGDGNTRFFYQDSTKNWNVKVPAASNNALNIDNVGGSDEYGLQIKTSVDSNNTSNHFIQCRGASSTRFRVLTNGNVVNSNNSYGSLSDEKLKENIVDSGSQWNDIKALKVRKYSLKEDKLKSPDKIGVIAQELEKSGMNGLVVESADLDNDLKDLGTVTKSVNYSVLYMKAVKALQEAMTRIETLESKVK